MNIKEREIQNIVSKSSKRKFEGNRITQDQNLNVEYNENQTHNP